MEEFSESQFERRLVELREGQKEIQALSNYVIHNRPHYRVIVRVWYKNLKNLNISRKLSAMYLVNDVVQNGRKKGHLLKNVEFWLQKYRRKINKNIAIFLLKNSIF